MAKGDDPVQVSVKELKAYDIETGSQSSRDSSFKGTVSRWVRLGRSSGTSRSPAAKKRWNIFFWAFFALTVFVAITLLIWVSLVFAIFRRLVPTTPNNGLSKLVTEWKEPVSSTADPVAWYPDFSSQVQPKPIHSHNDYLRDIPLFRALSVGCTGVEADIWLDNGDLRVAHTARHIKPSRTLRSLYLNPLMSIIQQQNKLSQNSSEAPVGVFDYKPSETLVLLLDFKSDPNGSFPLVIEQLAPFQKAGYLTRWDGSKLVQGPLTIVASGFASHRLDLVNLPESNGTIFLDAPLTHLSDPNSPFDRSNSLYASARTSAALGKASLHGFSKAQKAKAAEYTRLAEAKGLRSRFWQTPSWPLGLRDRVWKQLEGVSVGMLNVDDIVVAASWNLDRCTIAGFRMC